MPRRRDPDALPVVHRTCRVGVRTTRAQRERCYGLLHAAGDVWSCVLELNHWRWRPDAPPVVGYQQLCRELAAAGPGTFGELDSTGARSVLRRYADAWFAAAKRRNGGDPLARFPRRRRRLLPVRYYHGTLTLQQRRLRLPTAQSCPPLWLRLDRDIPYPAGQIRSVTLLNEGGRLWVEVTAEVPVSTYPPGTAPDPGRVAGVDLGIIHPYAVAGPDGHGLLVSGRAIRAEHRMHLADTKQRRRATAARAPKPGQRGSRRWRKTRRRARLVEGRQGPAPPPGPPSPARSRENGGRLGRRAARRNVDRGGPAWGPRPGGRAAAQPAGPAVADRPGHRHAARQGRTRRDRGAPRRRTRHILDLPGLPPAGHQTGRAAHVLPVLPPHRAP